MKFVNGLRPEVKMMVNYHGFPNFAQLSNMCRVFDEDQREKVIFYRNANASHGKEKKPMTLIRAKLYSASSGQYDNQCGGQRTGGSQPAGKGFQHVIGSS